MKLETTVKAKTPSGTLIFDKRDWLCIVILPLFLLLYFPSGKRAFSNSRNQQEAVGTRELRPEIGTRGLGLSSAFVSSTDDATSPLWNPAGLAALKHGDLIYDLSQGTLSFAYPIKPIGTFGVNFIDFNRLDRFLINRAANPIGTFEIGNNQALFSYAKKFGPVQLGANLGYSRAPYPNSRWAQNYDVGILSKLTPRFVVGMQYRDITGVTIRDESGHVLKTFAPQFALGATVIPHPVVRYHTCFNLTASSFGTSLEIVSNPLSASIGSNFSLDTENLYQSWSLGLSLKQWGKQAYYTYLNRADCEYKHLLAIGMHFDLQRMFLGISQPNRTGSQKERKPETSKYTCTEIAKQHNIDVKLMLAIIYVESNFNPVAVSKTGAGGLMQMIPGTARELGLKVPRYSNKLNPSRNPNVDERFDPYKNLNAGLTYFNKLLAKYKDMTLALGAYNIGPGKVRVGGSLTSTGRKYVKKVLTRYRLYSNDTAKTEADRKRLEIILNN